MEGSCCGCISLKRGSIIIGSFTFVLSTALFIFAIITCLKYGGRNMDTILGDDQLTQFALCITIAVGISSIFLLCGIHFGKIKFIKAWLITDGGLIFYFIERAFHLSEISNLSFLAFTGAFLALAFFGYIWTVVDAYYLELIKRKFDKDADSGITTPVVDTPPCKDNLYTELSTK